MANIPMKDIQFPGLDDTYTFAQVDDTLTTQGKAADAKKTGDEISELKAELPHKVDQRAVPYGYTSWIYDPSIWQGGGIYVESGENISSSSIFGKQRIRTTTFVTGIDRILRIDGGTYVFIYKYNLDGTYNSYEGRFSDFSSFDYENYKYRISLARVSEDTVANTLPKYAMLADADEIKPTVDAVSDVVLRSPIVFEAGKFNDNTGVKSDSITRIRNNEKIRIAPLLYIAIPEGFSALPYLYDANGAYTNYDTWKTVIKGTDYPNHAYINLSIRRDASPSGNITGYVNRIQENTIVNYDGKDPANAIGISASNVQEIVDVLNYYPEKELLNVGIDESGIEILETGKITTDYISIPKKAAKNLNYTFAFCAEGYASKIVFYNGQKEYISTIVPDGAELTEQTATYVRCVYESTNTKKAVCFSNDSNEPLYTPPKKYLLYGNDLFSYSKNNNSDGAINAIIRTGLRYLSDEQFGYGTEHTAFASECIKTTKDTHTGSSGYDGERYQMDCSTYVLLMLMGIVPECSRYFSDANVPMPYGYVFNELVEYEGYVYSVLQADNTKRLYANSIAEYAYKNGCLYYVKDDFSNVKPGDVFFLSNQGSSYHFFNNIGHCGMVVDVVPLQSGGNRIVTFEGNGGTTSPCKVHSYTSRGSNMIYGARFPMPFVDNDRHKIGVLSSEVSDTVSGVSGSEIDIVTVSLTESLQKERIYTVDISAEIPDNCFIRIKSNGSKKISGNEDTAIIRKDGRKIIRIFTSMVDTITNPDTITIQLYCTGAVSGDVTIAKVDVYDAFVTPEMH